MDAGTNRTCPRCGAGFHCGVNDTQPCNCSTLQLDPAALQMLRERYAGCVCLNCLLQLQAVRDDS